jgi:hypothetical protein
VRDRLAVAVPTPRGAVAKPTVAKSCASRAGRLARGVRERVRVRGEVVLLAMA